MEKILTIIIPTYNMEKYLDKCLTSLIIEDKELMKQLEVLVVIDGAKDRSSEIAHTYQDLYPETFVVIDKENGNYGSCINRGLKEAKGIYVKILDADDSFVSESLSEILLVLSKADVDLLITDHVAVDECGRTILKQSYNLPKMTSFGIGRLSKRMREYICMHDIIYKIKNLRGISYSQTEGISYTDQEWLFLPMTTVHTIVYYPIVLYRYLLGREGQTMNLSSILKMMNHNIIGFKTMLSEYNNMDLADKGSLTYIKDRLLLRAHIIYQLYLSNKQLSLGELIDFDNYIKDNNLSIYKELSNYPISHRVSYSYIKHWRKDKTRYLPTFVKLLFVLDNKLSALRRRIINKIY